MRSADIDVCLVGDSLANVALGYTSTQSLTLEAVIYHCQAVMRGLNAPLFTATAASAPNTGAGAMPLVLADMPFGSTFGSTDVAVRNVVRLVQETGIDGVKIEGSLEILPLVRALTSHGIPVMGHLGLQPQRIAATSGYRVQAKTAPEALDLLHAAQALQTAGCCSIVLECIPSKVGGLIAQHTDIPMIGIGAGSATDGQILVTSDMLGELTTPLHVLTGLSTSPAATTGATVGLNETQVSTTPKFVRNFAAPGSLAALRIHAVQQYTAAVRARTFPNDETEGYKIKSAEWQALLAAVSASTS